MNIKSTTDNYTYHNSLSPVKKNIIDNFILSNDTEIKSLLDIGCNSGKLSSKYTKTKDVLGIDLTPKNELNLPPDYNYENIDIATVKYSKKKYDLILFLSVYHHLLGKYGINKADRIFYRILTQSKYLLFDVGNTSEINRKDYPWFIQQSKIFNNEKELLDHFGVPYQILGRWDVAGGNRTIVLFKREDFYKSLQIVETYRRYNSGNKQYLGLIKESSIKNYSDIYMYRRFYKLKLGFCYFFAKEYDLSFKDGEKFKNSELKNLLLVYDNLDNNKLLFNFGVKNNNTLIFEWIDNLKYVKSIQLNNLPHLKDVNVTTDEYNKEYYIDFER